MIAAAILLGAAVLYAGALGAGGVTFDVTPLFIGVAALAAGLLGRARHLLGPGAVLCGWGAAVLLIRHGPLPTDREAPGFLIGVGVGLIAAHLVARRTGASTLGAAMTATVGGLAFYAAYDISALGRWPVWAGSLVAWAIWEAVINPRVERSSSRG
ncbi:MAG: hypothetical protein NVS1B12_17730 [Acidimicrobiales bacterium]